MKPWIKNVLRAVLSFLKMLFFLKKRFFQIWKEWYFYTMCCKLHYLKAPFHRYERLKNKKAIEGTLDHKQLNYNSISLTSSEAKTTANPFHLSWRKWKWQQVHWRGSDMTKGFAGASQTLSPHPLLFASVFVTTGSTTQTLQPIQATQVVQLPQDATAIHAAAWRFVVSPSMVSRSVEEISGDGALQEESYTVP